MTDPLVLQFKNQDRSFNCCELNVCIPTSKAVSIDYIQLSFQLPSTDICALFIALLTNHKRYIVICFASGFISMPVSEIVMYAHTKATSLHKAVHEQHVEESACDSKETAWDFFAEFTEATCFMAAILSRSQQVHNYHLRLIFSFTRYIRLIKIKDKRSSSAFTSI